MSNDCVITLIYDLIVTSITWPLYGYYLYKWYQNRHHFVICNRFPKISVAIISFVIIIQIISIIESSVCVPQISLAAQVIANFNILLVFYRAHLLFIRFGVAQQYLKSLMKSMINSSQSDSNSFVVAYTPKSTNYTICGHVWSRFIVTYAVFGSLAIIPCKIMDFSESFIYVISTFIGLISLINLLRKRELIDSIGCKKECLWSIAVVIIMLSVAPAFRSVVPSYINPSRWAGLFVTSTVGFVTLAVGINLIQFNEPDDNLNSNCENDAVTDLRRKRLDSQAHSVLSTPQITTDTSSSVTFNTQNSVSRTINIASHEMLSVDITNVDTKTLKNPLSIFLKESKRYILFAEYLLTCFALENLLFLERTIILYHIVSKYKKMDKAFADKLKFNGNSIENTKHDSIKNAQYYKVSFGYLSQIYSDMDDIVEKSLKHNNENDIMLYKRGIISIVKLIYDQFCTYDSTTEINVGYQVQTMLQDLLGNRNENDILNQFNNYDDLMYLFQEATAQCWDNCVSVYGFQFKSYLKQKNK